jgi:hypothetical protein
VPGATLLVVDTLSVDKPDELIDAGLKLACIPEGSPLAVKDTVPTNSLSAATLTPKLVLLPTAIDWELGVAESEKSGFVVVLETTRLRVVLWERLPLAPHSVSV